MENKVEQDRSTLAYMEPHPTAGLAMEYIRKLGVADLMLVREVLASNAIEGNRMAEVCLGTLNRILNREPVSDRYVLGLAWGILEMKI